MTAKQRVLDRERARGRADALDLAARASILDGTAIIAEEDWTITVSIVPIKTNNKMDK